MYMNFTCRILIKGPETKMDGRGGSEPSDGDQPSFVHDSKNKQIGAANLMECRRFSKVRRLKGGATCTPSHAQYTPCSSTVRVRARTPGTVRGMPQGRLGLGPSKPPVLVPLKLYAHPREHVPRCQSQFFSYSRIVFVFTTALCSKDGSYMSLLQSSVVKMSKWSNSFLKRVVFGQIPGTCAPLLVLETGHLTWRRVLPLRLVKGSALSAQMMRLYNQQRGRCRMEILVTS